jgi:hypothetical protein
VSEASQYNLPAFDLKGLDFLFILAAILGLYALHRLLAVKEEGEVEEVVVRSELLVEMRKMVRHVSNVAGLRDLTSFPYMRLKRPGRTLESESSAPPAS